MKSLYELYREHQGNVSDKWSIYFPEYDRLFSIYQKQPVSLLEIGIQNGGSLEIWSKFFKNAQVLVGCDINQNCAKLSFDDPRIKIIVGDANTDAAESDILNCASIFDLIIDDGSHTSGDIVKSFSRYFRHLNNDGIFIAEDLHCSYWSDFEGGVYYPYSSISFFKRLADIINHEHWGISKDRRQVLQGFSNQFGIDFDESDLAEIHSIEFFNSVCVVHKRNRDLNILGKRVVAGQNELVVAGHLDLAGDFLTAQNQLGNPWSIMDSPPDEDWERKSLTVAKQDIEVAGLKIHIATQDAQIFEKDALIFNLNEKIVEQNAQILAQHVQIAERDVQINVQDAQFAEYNAQSTKLNLEVDALRKSTSWRVTRPLRFVGHQIARIRHILKIAPSAFLLGGGASANFKKALALYRREGVSGIKRGLHMIQTRGQITPAVGSNSFDRNDYSLWTQRYDTIDNDKYIKFRAASDKLLEKPRISVVMPTYNPKVEWLIEAIESVKKQIYPNWELCIADDCSSDHAIRPVLEKYAREDERIKVIFRKHNGHISAASNSALEIATGEWVALLDHDDVLSAHALLKIAEAINNFPTAGLIYSDEDKLDERGARSNPYFKCDFDIDLLRSQNMICHLAVYRIDLLRRLGGFRLGFEGSQDYDLALRVVELLNVNQIIHIPSVLYHWRVHPESTAMNSGVKSYAQDAGLKALREHLVRQSIRAEVELTSFMQYRIRYSIPLPLPKVSLIIPTRNGLHYIRQCVESVLEKTTYKNYEVLIIDNGSDDLDVLRYFASFENDSKVKVLRDDKPFNYSALNNDAIVHASGEYIALLNNDVEVITPGWLDEMVSLAVQPGRGAVGACLWYPDDTLQHGGVILGIGGVAGHADKRLPRGGLGYFGRTSLVHGVSAVTAACLLIKKAIYLEVGGLNETELQIAFNDVDFCLKVQRAGFQNVWTPYAELYHHESATRGFEDTPEKQARFAKEVNYMITTWSDALLNDPAYNRNLTLNHEDFSLAWPPRTARH